jgi:sulfoquinovosidase
MKRRKFIASGAIAVTAAALPAAALQIGCSDKKKDNAPGEEYNLGEFILQKLGSSGLRVLHKKNTERVLWESSSDGKFLTAEKADADIVQFGTPEGFFKITDKNISSYGKPTIDSIDITGNEASLTGKLTGNSGTIGYKIIFKAHSASQLNFEIKTDNSAVNRVILRSSTSKEEAFFGFGEQMTYFDQKGNLIPILVQEHGVGRGRPIVTELVDTFAKGGGGTPYISEAPVPYFISSKLRSMFLENTEYSLFDMRHTEYFEVKLWSGAMTGRIIYGETPLDIIEAYTEYCGRMRALPDWINNGVVVSVQGGTQQVREKLAKLYSANVPLAALWIQDWCGIRITSVGKQLWWDWKLDETLYPGWDKLVSELESKGSKMMIYMNPFLSNAEGHNAMFNDAQAKGYLVNKNDGTPYMIKNSDFYAGIIDLSNPGTRTWIKDIIKNEMITKAKASGWMTDFAEAMPYDVNLYGKIDPNAWHNIYSQEWAVVHREAIEEAGRGNDIVFFNRSGFTQSPKFSTLFWLGDQLQSWDEYDGIKSAVVGMLSGGVSGFSLIHSDSGGFTTMSFKLAGHKVPVIARSDELFQRWLELGALSSVFRTHEGLDPAISAQFDSAPENTAQLARCGNIYTGLAGYRKRLIKEASEKGYPVARHLFLHYPNDNNTHSIRYQYLLGADMMVAPVVDKGADTVDVYFPASSEWIDIWTGQDAGKAGEWHNMPAPIGKPAIFLRKGSSSVNEITNGLKSTGIL